MLKHHQNFLFCTDLEPDDMFSLLIFIDKITEQAKTTSDRLKVAFLVGEGNSVIKAARMQKMLSASKKLELLTNVDVSVIRGYSDYTGSQKTFQNEGQDWLSDQECEWILEQYPNNNKKLHTDMQPESLKNVSNFLQSNENVLVIAIKPMREFQDLIESEPTVFSSHDLALTGSYNLRVLWQKGKAPDSEFDAAQAKTLKWLNAFKNTDFYETFSTTEINSTSIKNAPECFNLIDKADEHDVLGHLRTLIHSFKNYLLENDRKIALPNYLNKLENAISSEERQCFEAVLNDYQSETGERLRTIVDNGMAQYKNDESLLGSFRGLSRLLSKWKSMTQATYQTVNADPGLLALLSGECDHLMTISPVTIGFNGEYTAPKTHGKGSNTHLYLPGSMNIDDYLEIRTQQDVKKLKREQLPADFIAAQDQLLAGINQVMTNSVQKIAALEATLKQQDALKMQSGQPNVSIAAALGDSMTKALGSHASKDESQPDTHYGPTP